ncbi:Band 4.1-like protein 4A [Intoshia linei]|uniref:Band 4.1-like protein 4A n=1 Tax=Intoshia linei TaxID=1819745 RepID=A0A177BEN4_9BILA|nr:Band 4.1-like protein 4A [Intoshia linei]
MAFKLIRYFSRRNYKKEPKTSPLERDKENKYDDYHCNVRLLDFTEYRTTIRKNTKTIDLLRSLCDYLDLEECSFFGLCVDNSDASSKLWLDPDRKVVKQIKYIENHQINLKFKVKFYSSEPNNLHDDITKYLMYLQIKNDILTGSLKCPFDTSVELAALSLQSELGDWENEYTPFFVSEFRFDPNQNESMEYSIYEKYKELAGLKPNQCELAYLSRASKLDMYGVDFYNVLGKDGNWYKLGLAPVGVLIYDGLKKIGLFFWSNILNLSCKNKKLIFNIISNDEVDEAKHVFVFRLPKTKICKKLWNRAIEHHSFFRLLIAPQPKLPKKNFLRLGSKFRFSGRTEYQTTILQHQAKRKTGEIKRKPSRRYSRRESMRKYDNDIDQTTLRKQNIEYISDTHLNEYTSLVSSDPINHKNPSKQYFPSKTSTPNNYKFVNPSYDYCTSVGQKRTQSFGGYECNKTQSRESHKSLTSSTFSRDHSSRYSYRCATNTNHTNSHFEFDKNSVSTDGKTDIEAVPVILTTEIKRKNDSPNHQNIQFVSKIKNVQPMDNGYHDGSFTSHASESDNSSPNKKYISKIPLFVRRLKNIPLEVEKLNNEPRLSRSNDNDVMLVTEI